MKSDRLLISPYNNTAGSFIKIMGIKEIIDNLCSFDCYTNSPYSTKGKVLRRVWRMWILMLERKGLKGKMVKEQKASKSFDKSFSKLAWNKYIGST